MRGDGPQAQSYLQQQKLTVYHTEQVAGYCTFTLYVKINQDYGEPYRISYNFIRLNHSRKSVGQNITHKELRKPLKI